jgi:hypothetical protein
MEQFDDRSWYSALFSWSAGSSIFRRNIYVLEELFP